MQIPPGKYFISHSYSDESFRRNLLKKVPKVVKPHVFPPIQVSPDKFVSSRLMDSILGCDGLIYLNGGHSMHSFWVAFERDYALRADLPVYAATPVGYNFEFKRHNGSALDLQVYASSTAKDAAQAQEIIAHMRGQRYFNVADYETLPPWREDFRKLLRASIIEKMNKGGYLVVFWSKNAAESKNIAYTLEFGFEYGQSLTLHPENPNQDRVLIAALDDTPLPDWLQQRVGAEDTFTKPVQLWEDDHLSRANRIDNLVMRLYWLIFHNQYHEMHDE